MSNEIRYRHLFYVSIAVIAGLLVFGFLRGGDTETERALEATRERLREAVASTAEAEAANIRLGEELEGVRGELSATRNRLEEVEGTAAKYREQLGEYKELLAGYKEAVGINEEILARVTARNEEAQRILQRIQEQRKSPAD